MTHEYPRNPTFDSVSTRRVTSLADFGFTQRQREFLVTVMVHSGCFLERQYCAFTGTARGQNSREFVTRLVARGFARSVEPGPVRRGRLYYVHHKPLYEAIGLPDDRNRRLHSIGRMVERLMILDAVLTDRRCWWLSPAADKRTFFDARETGLRGDEYPHISFGAGRHKTIRCFPDKLPIGIDKEDSSRLVFLYLVNRRVPVDFRQFLIRHHTLFLNLHTWTVRLLVPRRLRKAVALYKAALREELWTPLDPSVSKALETYFRERRERGGHLGEAADRFIAKEFRRQGMAKIAALYRAWRREGDVVLWRSSSTSLRDDRMHGCSAWEVQNLDAQYLQLTTAVDREAWAKRGRSENRVRLAPPFRSPLTMSSHPWWLHDREPRSSVSIAATCGECVRTAALCAAVSTDAGVAIVGRVAYGRHVRTVRAGRTRRPLHMIVSVFAGTKQFVIRSQIGSARVAVFPREKRGIHQVGYRARHHRVFDAGAVLGVVNALRFALTRPAAGPSGIDDASARHVSGYYAMVVSVMVGRMALTCESSRSMLASSRQCRTAHPPFSPRANGARIRPAPTGHGIERILLTSPQSYLHACEP